MSNVNHIEAVVNALEGLEVMPVRRAAEQRPARLRAAAFRTADVLAALIACLAAATILGAVAPAGLPDSFNLPASFNLTGTAPALWLASALGLLIWLAKRGHHTLRLSWTTQVNDVLAGSAVALAFTATLATLLPSLGNGDWSLVGGIAVVSRAWLALWLAGWIMFTPILMLLRGITRAMLRANGLWTLRTMIVAPHETADTVAAALRSKPGLGYDVVGDVDPVDLRHSTLLQSIEASRADMLVVAADLSRPNALEETIAAVRNIGLPIATTLVCPGLSGLDARHRAFAGHDVVLLVSTPEPGGLVGGWSKQVMDRCGAAVLLLLLAPLFFLLTLLIRRDGGAALFRHQRLGANGQMFPCMKFRTMVAEADKVLEHLLANDPVAAMEWGATQKLRRDPRITSVGHFLRKSSLDELPQLFNVLRGEMSLVGPRPIVRTEIARYGTEIRYYYQARPGLTGLWQVSGRSDTSYAQRVELDVRYVANWTFMRDIVIVLKTIPAVLLRKGAV